MNNLGDSGVCGVSSDYVRRPPVLDAILSISEETEAIDGEIFRKFLLLAQNAFTLANDSRLAINGSVRYRIASRALDSGNGVSTDFSASATNSSLLEIFEYYAALEPPNAIQAKTFSDVLETNDTMELVEFMTFLRDFRVVPRLLAKKDVREVWQSISADNVAAGKGTFKKMNFDCFKDAIVRLGISAFCKSGLRNLITKVNGFSLNARHAVDYICKYLHLEDEQWVRNHIAVVGKESQGARNYRSQGEVDELALKTLAEERLVAKLEHRGKVSAEITATKKTRKQLLKKVSSVRKFPSAVDSIHTNPSKSLLPEQLKHQLYPEYYGLPAISVSEDDYIEPVEIQPSAVSATSGSAIESQPVLDNEGDSPLQVIKKFYDTSLVKMVSKYCVAQEHQISTRRIHSEGPFLDMGIVPVGARCRVRFLVTNKYRDSLYFDVRARDLECEDVAIHTQAAVLVPGLPRVVDVVFTINRGDRSVVGFVDLYCMATGSTVATILSCPIYYRVGVPLVDTRVICTAHSLNTLLTNTAPVIVPKKPPSHLAFTMTSPQSRVLIEDQGTARFPALVSNRHGSGKSAAFVSQKEISSSAGIAISVRPASRTTKLAANEV